ncbi:MAG: permease, partial [Deltaproteobacteria bacterium]|nr:permease [Deltaproteobacteria bacterium]
FGINRLIVFEIPLLGWKLVIARVLASLIFPFIIGLLTRFFYTRL